MTIYDGVLHEVGSGIETADHSSARPVSLDFIKIGETRIRNIFTTGYVSNFLRIGQELSISGFSVTGKFWIVAIKLPDGEIISSPWIEIVGPITTAFLVLSILLMAGIVGLIFGKFGFLISFAVGFAILIRLYIQFKAALNTLE